MNLSAGTKENQSRETKRRGSNVSSSTPILKKKAKQGNRMSCTQSRTLKVHVNGIPLLAEAEVETNETHECSAIAFKMHFSSNRCPIVLPDGG